MRIGDGQSSDAGRESMRVAVATVETALSGLHDDSSPARQRLEDSWRALVGLLNLEPPPEMRECPRCKHMGRLNASRCGYCWSDLPPLSAAA